MKYRGMFVEITPATGIEREDMDGSIKLCSGSRYRIYSDSEMQDMTDEFCAAVGFELPDDSMENAELFAREYIDSELKRNTQENNEQENGGLTLDI
ncbi:MAG: hypothetical protein IK093_19860 [Ruminiclostridium sp.]|nr:hypothetical protein [Ruminiclostridium sp.]